ncbi:FtsZ/tubulin family protein [Enterovibrio calviensis]|uniref:hypothetical protein n=1 Tax=Enterovibrio calviensis TaxID=91359 RepID=UPI0004853A1E|nr:hypothetical protein [Enterovibrio calviensis]
MIKPNIIASAALAVFLTACSDSDGGGQLPSNPSSPVQSNVATGKVADGYLEGATVCFDKNGNLLCDADEPTAQTGVDGSYELEATEAETNQYPLIAIVTTETIDKDTNEPVRHAYTLVSPPGKFRFVSPMTTLMALHSDGTSDASLQGVAATMRQLMGLSDNVDLFDDYIDKADDENYQQIHRVAQLIARQLGQGLTVLHGGESNSSASEKEMVAITGLLLSDVDTLTEIVDMNSDDFDADAIALSYQEQWQGDISSYSDEIDDIYDFYVNARSGPTILDGDAYVYIKLDGTVEERLEALFAFSPTLLEQYDLVVTGPNFSHQLTDADIIESTTNIIRFRLSFEEGFLETGAYEIAIASDNDDESGTIIGSNYFFPPGATPNVNIDWFMGSGVEAVNNPYIDNFISYPIPSDSLNIRASLKDSDGNIYYQSSFRKGRNRIAEEDDQLTLRPDSTLLVEVSDDIEGYARTFLKELYEVPVSQSNAKASIDFTRTYVRNRERGSETTTSFIYQFSAEKMVEDHTASPLDPIVDGVDIQYFNEVNSSFDNVVTHDVDYNEIMALGDQYDINDGDFNLWNSLQLEDYFGELINYLDAFYQTQTSIEQGLYVYSVFGTDGQTYHTYDFYSGTDSGFPDVKRANVSTEKVDGSWLKFSLPSAGENVPVYYQYQFYVIYEKDGESLETYLMGTNRSPQNVSYVRLSKVNEALAFFNEEYAPDSVNAVVIRANAWDALKSYNIDTRSESDSIDISPLLPAL